MSVNYYCKIVKQDKSEVVGRVDCWYAVRDYLMNEDHRMLLNLSEEEKSELPKYIMSKKELSCFLGFVSIGRFDAEFENLLKELESRKSKLELAKTKILAAKTKAAVEDAKNEVEFIEATIESLEETVNGFQVLSTIIDYELHSRAFYKNNKVVWREKEYKYRNDQDYNLYFFWS